MGNDFTKGAVYIKEGIIKDKAAKLRNEFYEKWKTARDEDTANSYRNLCNCYDEIVETKCKTEADVEALEWFFNNGKLRTESEMAELEEKNFKVKAQKKEYERQVKANVHAMNVEMDKKVQAMKARVEFFHGLGFLIIPFWTLLLEALFFIVTSLFGAFYVESDFWLMYFFFLVPGAGSYLIFTVVHKCIVNYKIRKMYEKGGANKPIDWSEVIEIGAIGYMLFGGKKK